MSGVLPYASTALTSKGLELWDSEEVAMRTRIALAEPERAA